MSTTTCPACHHRVAARGSHPPRRGWHWTSGLLLLANAAMWTWVHALLTAVPQ